MSLIVYIKVNKLKILINIKVDLSIKYQTREFSKYNIKIKNKLNIDYKFTVYEDNKFLYKSFLNILKNIIKFIPGNWSNIY